MSNAANTIPAATILPCRCCVQGDGYTYPRYDILHVGGTSYSIYDQGAMLPGRGHFEDAKEAVRGLIKAERFVHGTHGHGE